MTTPASENGQVLMVLGELKGQVSALQQFLTSRLDTQEKRIDKVEGDSKERAAVLHKKVDENQKAIAGINLKLAYWTGALMVAWTVLYFLLTKVNWQALF